MSTDNYDRIARFYDVDMARNMRFDDIAFYADLCAARPGRALELGCGSGRILLELLARGIDIMGVDGSAGMLRELQRKAAERGLAPNVVQMDLRRLALPGTFSVVLCPYSLITYLTGDDDAARLLLAIERLLEPDGALVVDAFVPRPIATATNFTRDYERPFAGGTLERWKRIVPAGALNRIERRYCVHDAAGGLIEEIAIAEVIRPYAPQALHDLMTHAGYRIGQTSWDYGTTPSADGAQFCTMIATRPR
jgi:SAM-dependent methyltransferase